VIDIVVSGIRGRMGQTLVRLAGERTDLRIVGGVDREAVGGPAAEPYGSTRIATADGCGALVEQADVVIDFSSAEGTAALLAGAGDALQGRALVVGTTGLSGETTRALEELASSVAVLTAANFSVGVNLLLGLAEQVAAALDGERFDVEIVEAHHRAKTDAPSGTALALGAAVAAGRGRPLDEVRRDSRSGDTGARPPGEVGFHAVRGGAVIGEHRVLFLGARETIELRHEALDRAVFADGALHAAAWLAGRPPGRYKMKHVLGL
jgi:4-hydroxy-tetrahydrodipicolinate reductase